MDFVVDNYFWFIVGAVAILMIVIGYIAEQTDFGRKPFREKKEKTKKVKEEKTEKIVADADMVVEEPTLDVQPEELVVENEVTNVEVSEELPAIEDSFEQPVEENLEEVISDEETAESFVGDEMMDFDIPEIESVEDNNSDTIEEVVADTDESEEDDVWKF